MSTLERIHLGDTPSMAGEALYVPRLGTYSNRTEYQFNGMGLVVGPSDSPDALHARVAGTTVRRVMGRLLDSEYQSASDELLLGTGLKIEDNQLIATARYGEPRIRAVTAWPSDQGYSIPIRSVDSYGLLGEAKTVNFAEFEPLFEIEIDRQIDNQTAKRDGLAVYAALLLSGSNAAARSPRTRLSEYHDVGVLVGESEPGHLAIAYIGQTGTSHYVLDNDGKPINRHGVQQVNLREGILYGGSWGGGKQKSIAKFNSKKFRSVVV